MNTELMLFARYEKPYVPLEDICMEYFGMCEKRAKLAAASQKLPVPVVRTMNSQKSPWMVKLSNLAVYIDAQHEKYRKTWEKVQGVLWGDDEFCWQKLSNKITLGYKLANHIL